MRKWLYQSWSFIRCLTGDSAYEQYVAHHLLHHPDLPLPDRKTFFTQRLACKWAGVKRCC